MSELNKLKERMNHEIKIIINKYNAAVFVLNGGSTTKAVVEFNYNVGGKSLRGFCKSADPDAYKALQEVDEKKSWFSEYSKTWYYDDVYLHELRENKHLFIGDAE